MIFLWAGFMVYAVVVAIVSTLAFRRGEEDERSAMLAFILAALGSQFASFSGSYWRAGPEYWVMAVDAALLVALIAVARHSRKFWPLWATASQLVGTMTHCVRFFDPSLAFEVYATTQPFWAFPLLLAIATGSMSRSATTASRPIDSTISS